MIEKLDEANNMNEKFKNQISSQVDKIKSLEEQLIESKTEIEKLTSVKLVVEPNSKEKKKSYTPPFKRNNEELKAKGLFGFSVFITYNSVSITHNSKYVGPMAEWFVWGRFQFLFLSFNSLIFLVMSYGN